MAKKRKLLPKRKPRGRIIIRKNIVSIGESAFKDCTGLTEIKLPKSLTRIAPSTFQYCSRLTSAVFADTTTEWELYQGRPLYACISGHDLRDAVFT